MRLRKRALAVISASLFLVAGLLPSVAVAEDTGPWAIGIYEFPKCLNVQGGSKKDSAKVVQYSCQSVSKYNDQWQLHYSGASGTNGDLYTLHNRNSNGTALIQYTCTGSWNDFFTWWPAR